MTDEELINYEDNPEDTAPRAWTHRVFHNEWNLIFYAANDRYPRWGVKEATLLTKLMKEYVADVLVCMMHMAAEDGIEFNVFYSTASKYHQKYQERTWKW